MKHLIKRITMLTLVTTLLVLATVDSGFTKPAAAPDFCQDCQDTCWLQAVGSTSQAWWQCVNSGTPEWQCENITIQHYNACVSIQCNYGGGCSSKWKRPRTGPGDN